MTSNPKAIPLGKSLNFVEKPKQLAEKESHLGEGGEMAADAILVLFQTHEIVAAYCFMGFTSEYSESEQMKARILKKNFNLQEQFIIKNAATNTREELEKVIAWVNTELNGDWSQCFLVIHKYQENRVRKIIRILLGKQTAQNVEIRIIESIVNSDEYPLHSKRWFIIGETLKEWIGVVLLSIDPDWVIAGWILKNILRKRNIVA